MKVSLKNFRVHEDATFDLCQGMTLIHGVSGSGKSTILTAINFAITGKGTKLCTHGKASCSVEISFKNISIKRSKRPNRLIFSKGDFECADEEAQEEVNRIFGINFEMVGYISQNNTNAFVLLNPNDKLAFLEQFIEGSLSEVKSKLKNSIVSLDSSMTESSSKLEVYEKIMKKQYSGIAFEKFEFQNPKAKLIDYISILDDLKTETIALESKIEKDEKTCRNYIKFRSMHEACEKAIDKEKEYIGDYKNLIKHINPEELEKIKFLEDDLETLNYNSKRNALEKELNELQTCLEKTKFLNKKKASEILVWQDYDREEVIEYIFTLEEMVKDINEIAKLQQTVKSINISEKNNIEKALSKAIKDKNILELSANSYECPDCNAKLRLVNGVLKSLEHEYSSCASMATLEKTIEKLNIQKKSIDFAIETYKKIKDLETKHEPILSLDEATSTLQEYKKYRDTQFLLEKDLDILLSKTQYSSQEKRILDIAKRLKQMPSLKKPFFNYTEKEINSMLLSLKIQQNDYNQYTKMIEKCKESLKKYESNFNKITETLSLMDTTVDENTIKINRDILTEKKAEIEKYTNLISEINRQIKQEVILADKTELEIKIEQEKILLQSLTDDWTACNKIKQKIKETESIAVCNILDTINNHVRLFLDMFFQESSMEAILVSSKETKTKAKTKHEISLKIVYKGQETDISCLSGGEFSRVVLAYTLAFAEMFNTPLIMLDECTSSLDQESTTMVLENIKSVFNEKNILIIAHQVVSGAFDNIYEI